MTVLLPV